MTSNTITDGDNFDRNGMLALTTATTHDTTSDWKDAIGQHPLEAWLESIKTFMPPLVYAAFNNLICPTAKELEGLEFYPRERGTYLDILEMPDGVFLYPGVAVHQTAGARTANHNTPLALRDHPDSPYYRIKHGPNCHSRFVTLLRIPLMANLRPAEKAHRCMLCRLAEAFFAYWLNTFQPTGRGSHLRSIAANLSIKMYGTAQRTWQGTTTHSPLMEQLGTEEFGTVRQARLPRHHGNS